MEHVDNSGIYINIVLQVHLMDAEKNIDYRALYLQECQKVKELEHQLEIDRIKLKKMISSKSKSMKVCPKCLNEPQRPKPLDIIEDKTSLKDFSEKVDDKIKKMNTKEKMSLNIGYSWKTENKGFVDLGLTNSCDVNLQLNQQALGYDLHPFSMIENFSVFGVSEESMKNYLANSSSFGFEPELLHSYKPASDVDKQASRLVFPSGIAVKKVTGQKAKQKAIQMMSYCYTNLKSFMLRFKCQENVDEGEFQRNAFLNHINPEKTLFCLCVGIHDYTSLSDDGLSLSPTKKTSNNSLKSMGEPKDELAQSINFSEEDPTRSNPSKNSLPADSAYSLGSSAKSVQSNSEYNIFISHRVFCISSYYPFFSFYEQILRRLINIIKMERLTIYKHNDENISETDSRFQLNKMLELFLGCMKDLNAREVAFNRSYQLKLINHQKIILLTDWNLAKTYFIDEWAFTILSIFSLDVLLDIYTVMMLENRVVFICDNSHILTYTIYLFAHILTKPLTYAFEVVSIIPQEDFLGAPFPVVYGMLRKRKYIEESNIFNDYANTYIFLAPDKVDIVYTENKKAALKARPQRLKADLTPLFKDLKKHRKWDGKSSAKYELDVQEYLFSSNMEERDTAVKIIEKVQDYIVQEVLNKLPTPLEIKHLKNSIDASTLPQEKDELSFLMQKIKQFVRKNNLKEPFADKMLDTQMISNFVCK